MRFADEVWIQVHAGDGGKGCVSFLRERSKPKGGPDGGDGGVGGSIWLCADERLMSLSDFHNGTLFRAAKGGGGSGRNRKGRNGADLELAVPCGTLAYADDSDELIADLTVAGQRALVARGGKGGLGNTRFRSSTNRTPRQATPGGEGDRRKLRLELRVLAEVGLLGKPNAGKSTLLTAMSSARPRTADYPFTTLTPQLGVADLDEDCRIVIADIPGLVAGAAEGRGLGHQFLRHLGRARLLLHLVDISQPDPAADLAEISGELSAYSKELGDKERWLVFNKTDQLGADADTRASELVQQVGWSGPWFAVSALEGAGLEKLTAALADVEEHNRVQH